MSLMWFVAIYTAEQLSYWTRHAQSQKGLWRERWDHKGANLFTPLIWNCWFEGNFTLMFYHSSFIPKFPLIDLIYRLQFWQRIAQLEDIIRRKNSTITRLKRDMAVLEQKVRHSWVRKVGFRILERNVFWVNCVFCINTGSTPCKASEVLLLFFVKLGWFRLCRHSSKSSAHGRQSSLWYG